MNRTRIKFCGITCAADAALAADIGADAVGMVFYPKAAVAVSPNDARAIAAATPPFVSRVALFVNPSPDEVRAAIVAASPHYLQFHGDESPDFCESFGVPFVKAVRVRDANDIRCAESSYPKAAAVLLDSFCETTPGGSGKSFDWNLARNFRGPPLMVAGGLSVANVAAAVATCRPMAVDVSSGISRDDDRRRKDGAKMSAFAEAVNSATRD